MAVNVLRDIHGGVAHGVFLTHNERESRRMPPWLPWLMATSTKPLKGSSGATSRGGDKIVDGAGKHKQKPTSTLHPLHTRSHSHTHPPTANMYMILMIVATMDNIFCLTHRPYNILWTNANIMRRACSA